MQFHVTFVRTNEIGHSALAIWPLIKQSRVKSKISFYNFVRRLQSPNKVGIHIRMKRYHSFIPRSLHIKIVHSSTFKKAKTTKHDGNTWLGWKVLFRHVTWPNHAKVIKATTPEPKSIKSAHPHRSCDLSSDDIMINEKRHITNFAKTFRHQIRKENIE